MDLKKRMAGKIIKGKLNGKQISEQWINVNDAILIAEKYGNDIRSQFEPRVKPFATEICIAHVKDGIEKYNRDAYKKCEEQLLKIIAILYHAQIDIKVKDIIPVEKEDVYWYKIKERTLDLGETLRITYWVDDLG